jgi:hypothetical protein
MSYFASGCTYSYEASWNRYYVCGWAVDGMISSFGADPGGVCSSTYNCYVNNVLSQNAPTVCAVNSARPRRSKGLGSDPNTYYILHTWLTASCGGALVSTGYLTNVNAVLINNATGTRLTMTCLVYTNQGTWVSLGTSATGLRSDFCYRFQIKCGHSYLNNSKFSAAGSTSSFWTQTCQPCY